MSRYLFCGMLMCVLTVVKTEGQISPGPLSKAHAELEGMSNCTQCHTIGKKVSNDKCMSCHDEIKTRMDQRTGYHTSREVRGKDCFVCHSDHHGRGFDMIHMDEQTFDHDLTGYELEGKHQKIDCRECHQPDYISEWELKRKPETFLGLEQECLSCHEDYHQRTLSTTDCARCHDTEAFAPAGNFNHDKAAFALRGAHRDVDCLECHPMEKRSGKEFQRFSPVASNNCNSCHEDAHENRLGANCKECHVEESFTAEQGWRSFDHSKTKFQLIGKHQQVNCAACHSLAGVTPLTVFMDRRGVHSQDCARCHQDVHENKFGNQCAECHDERSFRIRGNLDQFNHSLTGFDLEGKHRSLDCRKCHKTDFLDPLPHNSCTACHEDYHQGQFMAGGRVQDCARCHSVEGFGISKYTISDHSHSKFPLEGAHVATPCFECHLQANNRWSFRSIGQRCIDCHDDVHSNEIDPKFYPGGACEQCHTSTSWADSRFDHSLTAFTLAGAHTLQPCSACHVSDTEPAQRQFQGIQTACSACHEDHHFEQFTVRGQADCARCHDNEDWKIEHFNHNRTAFKLEGKHRSVACNECHKPIEVDGNIFVQYNFKSFECIVCHQ